MGEGADGEYEDYMPAGVEVLDSEGEVSILLSLSEPSLIHAARKMSLLLHERLDIYCRYPDFSGLIFFSLNPEGVEPSRPNRIALERLVESRRKDPEFAGRVTLSGKPVRFEADIGTENLPRGERARLGLREEFRADAAAPEPPELNEVRSEESGLDVLVVSIRAANMMVAVNRVNAFVERELSKFTAKPNADGWVIFNLALEASSDEAFQTLNQLILKRNLEFSLAPRRTQAGVQVWLTGLAAPELLTPEAALARAIESRQAQREELQRAEVEERQSRERAQAEKRRRWERSEAEALEKRAQRIIEEQARAQVFERQRERALVPAALFVVSILALDFVLGVRSGAFGVVSAPLLRLIAGCAAFAAVFGAAWAGAARFVLAGLALGEALGLGFTLLQPTADRASLLLASAQLRVLLLVVSAVFVLVARDRSRSALEPKSAECRPLLGGFLGLLICLITPRPAVVVCRDPPRPYFKNEASYPLCHEIADPAVCGRVAGCSVSAVCRAPAGFEGGRVACSSFSERQSCSTQTFCQWIACDGVPNKPCAGFPPGECPARMCQLHEY